MTPKYIDIHAHLNFKAFDKDRDAVIKRALENNTWMINVGTQVDTSKKAIELAHQYKEGVYAIVGLHPIHTSVSFHDQKELGEGGAEFTQTLIDGKLMSGFTSRGEIFDKNIYRELLKDKKVVAIGECGLDYYHMDLNSIEKQKKVFIEQIELANEVEKPLMLHIRNNPKNKEINAYADALEILKKYSKVKGNVHFFAGNLENAKAFIEFGFALSFTGVVTFANNYDEIIKNIPLQMIMSETDSPYVAPVPHRGTRNEPYYVKEVVKKIALVKNLPEQNVAKAMIANSKRVFGI